MHRRTFLSTLGAAPFLGARTIDNAFRQEMERAMAVGPVPGMVIGVVPGRMETFGPVNADTVFQAASLSKQVTAYIAFALRDHGKLDFSLPLVSYVDDISDPRSRRATIRQVLSHSTGFPNWRFEAGQGLLAEFEPGEQWRYSGEGYVYLQRIIEKVADKPFSVVVDELAFGPLGMRSSAMRWKPEWDGRYAAPHRRDGKPIANWDRGGKTVDAAAKKLGHELRYKDSIALVKDGLPNGIAPNAAASMVTTANDYARFVAAAIKNQELLKPQVTMRSGKDWFLGWGLGWGIERVAGHEYLWQWGDNGGYKNVVFAEPKKGTAVFVFTNGEAGRNVYDRVVRHVTGHDHPALLWI